MWWINMKKFNAIDLFSGAGGLSFGFEKAGINTAVAVEFNPIYAKSFQRNFPDTEVYVGDIRNISDDQILEYKDKYSIDIIIGGPPCQGFSLAGNIGRRFLDDDRNRLFLEYLRFVRIIKPKMFVLENVAAMVTHNKGRTISEIIDSFTELGYSLKYQVLNAVNYCVPQERRRVFIIGMLNENTFVFPDKDSNIISISQAIGDLPVLSSGESSNIPLHQAMNHSKQMLQKMGFVSDGGSRMDIPAEIRPTTGDVRKYIRYNSKLPSVCVTGDMRKIFHYSQNRALTCRELARLQTFPDTYMFCGSSIEIQQQIGNAVPCMLAYAIAKECVKALSNE